MGSIPFVPEPNETIGKITGITTVTSQYEQDGKMVTVEKIQLSILPANPEAANERLLLFPYKQNLPASSKWMRFLASFSTALLALTPHAHPVASESDMIGTWVRIAEEERPAFRAGQKPWTQPLVIEIYATPEAALIYWQSKQSVVEEPSPETPAPEAKPEPPMMPVNPAVVPILKNQWTASGQDPDKFWALVSSWGYTKEQVLEAVK